MINNEYFKVCLVGIFGNKNFLTPTILSKKTKKKAEKKKNSHAHKNNKSFNIRAINMTFSGQKKES